jgi:endonuclease/exonuclease/phosphatase family metal-dependent hydrolase
MNQITIATINLRNRVDRWRERRHLLVNQIYDVLPDLIALQEVFFPNRQGPWLRNQINIRLKQVGERPYRLILRRKRHPIHGYYEGVGVLTRLPVRYHDHLALGYGGRVALRVNVELPDHESLDFVTVHLHHIPADKEARHEQVMRLTGWLEAPGKAPLQVVAGDFNETPDGPAIRHMKQGFRSAYETVWGRDPLATFPTALLLETDSQGRLTTTLTAVCLDYLFVSPAINVEQAALFCDRHGDGKPLLYPSDHVGIVSVIRWA